MTPPDIARQLKTRVAHAARVVAARCGLPNDRDLVISFLFPPANETSGVVMAKRIHDWPRDVDVVANQPPSNRQEDPGTLRVAGPRLKRVKRVKGRRNPLKNWAVAEHFSIKGSEKVAQLERERGRYRRVYSRSMMPSSHLLAIQLKLDRPSLRWTAEFSDPLLIDTLGERRTTATDGAPLAQRIASAIERAGVTLDDRDNMFELIEYGVYVLADKIVFTNPAQRDLMLSQISSRALRDKVAAKATVSPHPAPAPDLYTAVEPTVPLPADRLTIGYFGAFYNMRGVSDLVTPFQLLPPEERRHVQLFVFTDRVEAAAQTVEELGLSECVTVHGFVPYLEFLALTKQLDALLVADARVADSHGINPYLPSKVSDYSGSGTHIWALVEHGSPLSQYPGVTATPIDDDAAKLAHLRLLIEQHVHGQH